MCSLSRTERMNTVHKCAILNKFRTYINSAHKTCQILNLKVQLLWFTPPLRSSLHVGTQHSTCAMQYNTEIDCSEVTRRHFRPGFHGFYVRTPKPNPWCQCRKRGWVLFVVCDGGKVIKRQVGEIVEHFDPRIKRILLAINGCWWWASRHLYPLNKKLGGNQIFLS
jgi:hypothetical protein